MSAPHGGIAYPNGFRAAGVLAEIKAGSTKLDCALVVSDTPATLAGMFTTNVMKSPPVTWNQGVCANGAARAVFINSGNANAATGEAGRRDVATESEWLASELGVGAQEICICSTGVIGVPLPMDRIHGGIRDSVAALSEDGGHDAALAIMTTDTVPKEAGVEVELECGKIRIGAMAKGSGMISPDMATMICVFTTDAAIEAPVLSAMLREAVDVSFHQICVDNDLSTSDTVLVLANGQGSAISEGTEDCKIFQRAFTELCQHMAKAIVKDGEGATKFVEIRVTGTGCNDDARSIARALGHSQLCKTAFFGQDPNWGRFACAAGYAGVDFDPSHLKIQLNDLILTEGGLVADYEEAAAAAIMHEPQFTIGISVGEGPGRAVFWTSDLSHEYVSINADYRT